MACRIYPRLKEMEKENKKTTNDFTIYIFAYVIKKIKIASEGGKPLP